ncbi:MAG: hypothetical protein H7Z42_12125, partial [Roseiflexaceae bacterium]|nr:hypothetical protein [Roseiflexaceae bacterium]
MIMPILSAETAAQPARAEDRPEDAFVGRAHLRAIVDDFRTVKNRILVFVASPGIGKTAFIKALEREHADQPRPFIAHYCAEGDSANPEVFCERVSAKLHQVLGPAFALPMSHRKQEVQIATTVTTGSVASGASVSGLSLHIGTAHPREAFRMLIREPLRAYNEAASVQRDQPPLVLLIDALDCAWDWDSGQGGTIVDLLSDAQDLPAWVSVICTARPGQAVQALQSRAGVQIVPIDPRAPENLADVSSFLHEQFLARIDADDRSALEKAVQAATPQVAAPLEAFIARVTMASQGNFLFVRRYVDALRDALDPANSTELAALVQVDDSPDSLQAALDGGYAQMLASIQVALDRSDADADADTLWMLAVAYTPVTVSIIARITGCGAPMIELALKRLTPLLDPNMLQAGRYTFFHAGFADFYRRIHLGEKTRELNLRVAQALSDSDQDEHVRAYARQNRWQHLRRGLRLTWPSNPTASYTLPMAAPSEHALMLSPAEVQRQVPQPAMQAQALRGLAVQALAPELADVPGSWTRALAYLQAAAETLPRSRALRRRRQPRYASAPPAEAIELEKTYTAIGDAYVTIGQRMDLYIPSRSRPRGLLQLLHLIWDAFARLPLTLFLLIVLAVQGTRELRLTGALQNLGRGQDWTVARQYVLAVVAYRRARVLAAARDDGAAVDDILERLARLYGLMGAFDTAGAAYSELMARPTALARQWHQAIWRLELGEVLLSGGRFDQAVDMFSSARLMFETQETNVQLARTLGGLARGHYQQARLADQRGDTINATDLYNSSLAESTQALETWQRVTTLRNADLGLIDPQIGISGVCHKLWEASHDQNLDVEQQQRARSVLDRIDERHFPQRFEHPVLRLFRIGVAIALPLYLIGLLILAVQLPNHIQVQTTTDLTVASPELQLGGFPDNILDGRAATFNRLSEQQLHTLTANGVQVEVGNNWFTPETLATATGFRSFADDLIYAVLFYYLLYLAFGLVIIFLSSPDRFQVNRPGRLVLTRSALEWRGRPGQNPVLAILHWLRGEASGVWRGKPGSAQFEKLAELSQVKLRTLLLGSANPAAPSQVLPLDNIGLVITADLHLFGSMLYDFSYTVVRPKNSQLWSEFVLEGRLIYYRELISELRARVCTPQQPAAPPLARHYSYSVELVRSRLGLIFCATLAYAAGMLLLLRFAPATAFSPIALVDYSLSSLYVLITPGLLLPLIWWFVFKPMGVFHSRASARLPLLVATAAGALIALLVLVNGFSLAGLGLKPDLALPTLAAGILLTVAWYARPRRHSMPHFKAHSIVLRTMLAGAASAGLVLLIAYLGYTVAWYDALVRGNTNFARAALMPSCFAGTCPELEQAAAHYSRAVALKQTDGDGYALRGLVALSQYNFEAALDDFQQAA